MHASFSAFLLVCMYAWLGFSVADAVAAIIVVVLLLCRGRKRRIREEGKAS